MKSTAANIYMYISLPAEKKKTSYGGCGALSGLQGKSGLDFYWTVTCLAHWCLAPWEKCPRIVLGVGFVQYHNRGSVENARNPRLVSLHLGWFSTSMIMGERVLFAPPNYFCVYFLIGLLCMLLVVFFWLWKNVGFGDVVSFFSLLSKSIRWAFRGSAVKKLHPHSEDVVLKRLEDELIKPLSPDIFMIASTNRTWLEEMKSTMDFCDVFLLFFGVWPGGWCQQTWFWSGLVLYTVVKGSMAQAQLPSSVVKSKGPW